jgi:hypothetical protein
MKEEKPEQKAAHCISADLAASRIERQRQLLQIGQSPQPSPSGNIAMQGKRRIDAIGAVQ